MPPDLVLRKMEPGDAHAVQQFVRRLSAGARTERYFAPIRELNVRQLERVTHPVDPRDVSLAVLAGGEIVALGECYGGEFAVVVADAWQRLGLGEVLLRALLAHAAEKRLPSLHGLVRERNRAMLRLVRGMGFGIAYDDDPGFMRVEHALSHA
jgi:acetyltransferase